MDDWQLLRQYAEQNSQEAFATLTRRYVNLVYSVCRRELSDPDLADDVTQAVFLILARKASSLRRGVILSGWLFHTARFAAKNAGTRERRRQQHEQEAAQQAMIDQSIHEDTLWNGLEPFLNQALANLGTGDRDAVLLRCLEGRSFPETGRALGVSEEAARKRVSRGLEKLRRILVKEGVIVSSAALAALLSARAVHAAPVTCAPAVAQATLGVLAGQINAGLVGSHAYQISQGVLRAMWITKAVAAVGVVALVLAGTVAYTDMKQSRSAAGWEPGNAQLSLLGPKSVLPGFSLRPPKGYGEKTFTQFAEDSRMDTYAWSLPRRADGTTSFFQVIHITNGTAAKSLDQLAANEWRHTRKELAAAPITDAVFSKEEAGQIDSIPFRRIHWQGTYRPATGPAQKRRGFDYVGMVGARDWFYFESADCEPYVQETLPTTEAAVLTLQRK